ncbi:MAG: CRISPR-associated protein Csx20, partial [Fusobacteriaceae bacterium]
MKTLFLLFSHKLTEEQVISANQTLNCKKMVYLPEILQNIWSNIPAKKESYEYLEMFQKFLLDNSEKGDYVLIQGEWGYSYKMVNFCKENDLNPIYSTTERDTEELLNKDGSITKISKFKHVMYKSY